MGTATHVAPVRHGIEHFNGSVEYDGCNSFKINGTSREFAGHDVEIDPGLRVVTWIEQRRLRPDELTIVLVYMPDTRRTVASELTYAMWQQLVQRDMRGVTLRILRHHGIDI